MSTVHQNEKKHPKSTPCVSYAKNDFTIRVRGVPERRMQVLVCGTGRGLDNDAGFVVLVVLVVVVVVVVLVVPSP